MKIYRHGEFLGEITVAGKKKVFVPAKSKKTLKPPFAVIHSLGKSILSIHWSEQRNFNSEADAFFYMRDMAKKVPNTRYRLLDSGELSFEMCNVVNHTPINTWREVCNNCLICLNSFSEQCDNGDVLHCTLHDGEIVAENHCCEDFK